MQYGLFGTLLLIADIYAIYQIFISGASLSTRLIWALAVFILPVLGFLAWLIAGPRGTNTIV